MTYTFTWTISDILGLSLFAALFVTLLLAAMIDFIENRRMKQ